MDQRDVSRGPRGTARMLLALLAFVGAFVGEAILGYAFYDLGMDENLAFTLGGAIAAAVLVCALGGRRLLRPTRRGVGGIFRLGWWLLVVSAFLGGMDLYSFMQDPSQLSPHWAANVANLALLCLCIGVEEECMFRALLLGGMQARLGGRRGGLVVACVLSSLLFGCAHISFGDVAWGDPLQSGQAVLKIAQTGTYGFVLAVAVVRDESISGVALFHGLDDFLVMFVANGLLGEANTTNYVSSGSDAAYTLFFYGLVTILYLPVVWRAARELGRVRIPCRGAFYRAGHRANGPAAPVPPEGMGLGAPMPRHLSPGEKPVATSMEGAPAWRGETRAGGDDWMGWSE